MQQRVQITSGERVIWGTITQLSEIGAEIQLNEPIDLDGAIALEIPEENLTLLGKLTYINLKNSSIRVKFNSLTPDRSRRLVEFLFCRPGQWKNRNTPGEWRSLWLLFIVLFRPIVFLFGSFDKDKRKKRASP
ncbi:MAG: PilZ domain-containing protein [Hydrococcus sp. Prado102]|nr:PilZ domain-containing protein [Hydrococcus sp. Prado102]